MITGEKKGGVAENRKPNNGGAVTGVNSKSAVNAAQDENKEPEDKGEEEDDMY